MDRKGVGVEIKGVGGGQDGCGRCTGRVSAVDT